MTLIKYKDGVGPLSGHDGGVVFAGEWFRHNNSHVDKKFPDQLKERNRLTNIEKRYAYTLTAGQRSDWEDFADAQGIPNGGGPAAYAAVNFWRSKAGQSYEDTPPDDLDAPTWDNLVGGGCWWEDWVSVFPGNEPFPASYRLRVWAGPGYPWPDYGPKSEVQYMGLYTVEGVDAVCDITVPWKAAFGGISEDYGYYWCAGQMLDLDNGQLSAEKWVLGEFED